MLKGRFLLQDEGEQSLMMIFCDLNMHSYIYSSICHSCFPTKNKEVLV